MPQKILWVDDEADIVSMIQGRLEVEGYEVMIAELLKKIHLSIG